MYLLLLSIMNIIFRLSRSKENDSCFIKNIEGGINQGLLFIFAFIMDITQDVVINEIFMINFRQIHGFAYFDDSVECNF